jgi:hypothetical protein
MHPMSLATAPDRRIVFRYRLRTFLLVVAAIGLWLGWRVHQVHYRETVRRYLVLQGAVVHNSTPGKPWKALPLAWSLFGSEPVDTIELPGDKFSKDDLEQIAPWFPEADVSIYRSGGMGMGMM